jgi:hypothetical protein
MKIEWKYITLFHVQQGYLEDFYHAMAAKPSYPNQVTYWLG